MIKATNPLTGKFDFVADNIAERMRKDIAFKGYRFEPAGPDAPESNQVEAPAEPPEVNMPERIKDQDADGEETEEPDRVRPKKRK